MSNNYYNLGIAEFNKEGYKSPEYINQQHPLFRAGYNAAVKAYEARNANTVPNELYVVPKKKESYVPTYNDIVTATRLPRYRRLHTPCMKIVLRELIRAVENNMDKIKTYSDLSKMVAKAFNLLLQEGYDLGVLSDEDMKYHQYTPVQKNK